MESKIYPIKNGYIHYNGKVQHFCVNFICVEIADDNVNIDINCVVGGEKTVISVDSFDDIPCIATSEENCINSDYADFITFYDLLNVENSFCNNRIRNNFYVKANGKVVRKDVDDVKAYNVKYDENGSIKTHYTDFGTIYSKYDLCVADNSFEVIDADGNSHIVDGVIKKCALTDEQKAVVKELEDVLQKVTDSGLKLYHREWNEHSLFVMRKDINVTTYGEKIDQEDYFDFTELDTHLVKNADICDFNDCSDGIFVKLREEEE